MSSTEQALLMEETGSSIIPIGSVCYPNSTVPYVLYKTGTVSTLATQVSATSPYGEGMLGPPSSGLFTIYNATPASSASTATSYTLNAATGAITTGTTFSIANPFPEGILGSTDTSLFACATSGASVTTYETLAGTTTHSYTLNETFSTASIRFARSGSYVVFGWSAFSAKKIYKHNLSGGTYVTASAALPDWISSLLIVGTTVYAASQNNLAVYVLDLATLTLQSTLTLPTGIYPADGIGLFVLNGNLSIVAAGAANNGFFWSYINNMWRYVGVNTYYLLPGNSGFQQSYQAYNGNLYCTYTYSSVIYFLKYPVSTISQPQSLLLHFDGTNGSTTFTDSSGDKNTFVIPAGSPQLSTAQAKFGVSSLLGGTGTNNCRIVSTLPPLTYTNVDWTWSCWVNRTSNANSYCGLVLWEAGGWSIVLNTAGAGGNYKLTVIQSGSAYLAGATTVPLTTWTHLCVSYQYNAGSSGLYIYINGTLDASIVGTAASIDCPNGACEIGRANVAGNSGLNAYVDEFQIIPGYAITSNFTVPGYPSCDGSNSGGGGIVTSGTAFLTGLAIATGTGAVNQQASQVALVGAALTSNTGTLGFNTQITNPTLAITGNALAFGQGTLVGSQPPYPALINTTSTNASVVASNYTADAILTVVLHNDGSLTAIDSSGYNWLTATRWIATSVYYTTSVIAGLYYAVVSPITNGGLLNTSGIASTLASGGTVVADLPGSGSSGGYSSTVTFQITVLPTSSNPRYGEIGYAGTIYVSAVLQNLGTS